VLGGACCREKTEGKGLSIQEQSHNHPSPWGWARKREWGKMGEADVSKDRKKNKQNKNLRSQRSDLPETKRK
jgi:hypothetical protein